MSTLVEDLKVYELPHVSPRTPLEATEFRRTITGSAAVTPMNVNTITALLETAMEELFVPYTEGQRYLERECRSITSLYANALAEFARYHVSSLILERRLANKSRRKERKSQSLPCLIAWSIN